MSDILVPTLGESVTEATVGKWLKKPGEAVRKDEPVVELETDKVAVEAPAPQDGVLSEIVAKEGETVGIGAILGRMSNGAAATAANPRADAKPAAPAAPTSSGGAVVDVTIPQMGESVSEGAIGAWLVKVGDTVKSGQPLVEIETDKVAVEAPSPVDGVIAEILVKTGDTVGVGALIARVREGAGSPVSSSSPAQPKAAAASTSSAGETKAMPSARRVMEEHHIDPASVAGSGKDGRILKGDALKALETAAASTPATKPQTGVPRPLDAREERVPMTRLRQTIARRLKEAQNSAAMLTTFNEADMGAIMAARTKYKDLFERKHGVKLGFMSFFVKACVTALKEIPAVNAEIDGADIIYKNYYDIGIAVGTDRGLVVPVVRAADQKSLGEIEADIGELGRKARDGELTIADMQGATFTITNGGVYGSLMSTPILNAPQSGILGMHKIAERPMAVNGKVEVRPMMYLALSYDHRIVDGKEAVTFLVRVKESLEDPERLLLDL